MKLCISLDLMSFYKEYFILTAFIPYFLNSLQLCVIVDNNAFIFTNVDINMIIIN